MIYMTFFQDLHNTENRIFKFNGMNTFPPLGHWRMNIEAAKTNQEGLKALGKVYQTGKKPSKNPTTEIHNQRENKFSSSTENYV